MAEANAECDEQNAKIALYETQKQTKITNACSALTTEELRGANDDGLNFATLNAGCLALDPNYTCSLQGLMNCVGGPLQRTLAEQTSALLDPRAPDAAAAIGLHSLFSGLGVTRKVKENVPAGKADLWAISGQAGDQVTVRVKTRDENGNGTSNLHPALTLLGADLTPVADTIVRKTSRVPSRTSAVPHARHSRAASRSTGPTTSRWAPPRRPRRAAAASTACS